MDFTSKVIRKLLFRQTLYKLHWKSRRWLIAVKLQSNPEWRVVGCLTRSDILGSLVEVSRETSPTEDGVPPAEEATEATEADAGVGDEEEDQGVDLNQPGIYTEHVFTDPLGVEPRDPSPSASKYLFFSVLPFHSTVLTIT